jgi:hypothetical protein
MPQHVQPEASRRSLRRALSYGLTGAGTLVFLALGFFAWQSFYPVQAASNWHYRVIHPDVQKAASMVVTADGGLLVSQELKNGQGSILRISAEGTRSLLVEGLSKPDGMIATQGGIVFSQEGGTAPVNFLRDGQTRALFMGTNAQGLWSDEQYLYVIEDRKGDGRLLRYQWSDQSLEVLRDALTQAESITRCADGSLLYSEKIAGVVRRLTADRLDPVVVSGLKNPTYLMCDQRGLWISEDSTHRARLLLVDAQGKMHTVLSYLKAPQAIMKIGEGRYLLAEGGRNRVLELTLDAD